MSDWDAASYHRVSDPQYRWGLPVLERLRPADGERILDVGCGTGRLTRDIARRAPACRVFGTDRSAAMLREASVAADERIPLAQADATALPIGSASLDAVFSTAVFHWVLDHDLLFDELFRVLCPGGRLVAQAGGEGNLATLRRRSNDLCADPEFGAFFIGWREPWKYAGVAETTTRLERAGFAEVRVWMEDAPTPFPDDEAYAEFVSCVCLRRQLERLPDDRRASYVRRITGQAAGDATPYTLDYRRLNIDARKP